MIPYWRVYLDHGHRFVGWVQGVSRELATAAARERFKLPESVPLHLVAC